MKKTDEILKAPNLVGAKVQIGGGSAVIHLPGWKGTVIWTYTDGWEHVSVAPYAERVIPSWNDMCRIKDIFWKEDEAVVQYHPAKSDYVNIKDNCLHLWRPTDGSLPVPPKELVY